MPTTRCQDFLCNVHANLLQHAVDESRHRAKKDKQSPAFHLRRLFVDSAWLDHALQRLSSEHGEMPCSVRDSVMKLMHERVFPMYAADEDLKSVMVHIRSVCGITTAGYPECLAVLNQGSLIGSGVLVADKVVATAAHMLNTIVDIRLSVGIGSDVWELEEEIDVERVPDPPDRHREDDVALLVLQNSPTRATPVLIAESEEIEQASAAILVGFGGNQTPYIPAGHGCKRRTDPVNVAYCTGRLISFNHPRIAISEDDSGGPCYLHLGTGYKVMGVADEPSGDIGDYQSKYTRLDQCTQWIEDVEPN